MAAAFARAMGGGRAEVLSAGSAPADAVHDNVRAVMREVGIDLEGARPKALSRDAVQGADVVVTMGCGDACPAVPGKRHEDWAVADPAGRPIEEVRAIREDLRLRVRGLLESLGIVPGADAR